MGVGTGSQRRPTALASQLRGGYFFDEGVYVLGQAVLPDERAIVSPPSSSARASGSSYQWGWRVGLVAGDCDEAEYWPGGTIYQALFG